MKNSYSYSGYHQMHLLKKLDYKGFIASFCGVLMITLICFFLDNYHNEIPNVTLVEAKNYQYEPQPSEAITITLRGKGDLFIGCGWITDLSPAKFEILLEDHMMERHLQGVKVLFKADPDVEFGEIIRIFQSFSRVGIKTVGLVTKGWAWPVYDILANKARAF